MKRIKIALITLVFLVGVRMNQLIAQTISSSDNLSITSNADRTVLFNVSDEGKSLPVLWGLDTAWDWDVNFIRGSRFMGSENVDLARVSFTPSEPLANGTDLTTSDNTTLETSQTGELDWRLSIVDNYANSNTKLVLNCDHDPIVDTWFWVAPERWAQLMDQTTRYVQNAGRTVVTISPFNEPDYGWGQAANATDVANDFSAICALLKQNSLFDNIRISGGNTLSCDQAFGWYDYIKEYLDEGNTHQLAGSFDSYAAFYETVRSNGDHATADELHNVAEAMVGAEYGMQTGIWWGAAELARAEFCKISDGNRLGYAEHRDNWTAASVYKGLDGKIQAFTGGSERQATTTTFRFISKDQPVFYDGYGPQYEFIMEQPGGDGYGDNQPNAERVINITQGEDIQPIIDGQYVLVNRNSGKVIQIENGSSTNGANLIQGTYSDAKYQQWEITPLDNRNGGDFSYFYMTSVANGLSADIYGWSLDNGGNVATWSSSNGTNQHYSFEYIEDGWFYIRSRYSAKYLEVADANSNDGGNIQQMEKNGNYNQMWRLVPVGSPVEFEAPSAPKNLTVTANTESVQLDWTANSESDLSGYTILRAESSGGPYYTIARNVTTTSFVDNSTKSGTTYFYVLKATDNSLNSSSYSNEVSSSSTGEDDLIAHYSFDNNITDNSVNLFNAISSGNISYVNGNGGKTTYAISLNSTNAFVKLPATLANKPEMTISLWIRWLGGDYNQRIFDFGNGESEYMYLTPKSSNEQTSFTMYDGETEQTLVGDALPTNKWSHISVSLGLTGAKLFINGILVDQITNTNIDLNTFKPVLNYIGRSQSNTNLFYGYVDDFRVYNYEFTEDIANELYQSTVTSVDDEKINILSNLKAYPIPANNTINISYNYGGNNIGTTNIQLINTAGQVLISQDIDYPYNTKLPVADYPKGTYLLKVQNQEEQQIKKIIISH